jgi:benzodiazapine receptor
MRMIKFVKLAAAVLVCQAAGLIGSVFTVSGITTWYASINKPVFNPPNWIFAPVWTTLFLLMGVAAYLVWEKGLGNRDVRFALSVFGAQLALNVLWSLIFFGLQNPFYAFIEILFLWVAIALAILRFSGISRNAALLMVPYIAWVSFAAFLNYHIWMLNP